MNLFEGALDLLFGRVVDGTGVPVPDAEVYVADRGAHTPLVDYRFGPPLGQLWPSRTLAEGAGRFSLRGIRAPSAANRFHWNGIPFVKAWPVNAS